jgi:hypothetical protein
VWHSHGSVYSCRLRAIFVSRCRLHEILFLDIALHFIEGLFLSPLHFMGASSFIGGLFLSSLRSRGASFFIEGLFLSPGASFFIGGLFLSPLRSMGASFLSEVFFLAPCVLWVPLFHWRSFS